MSERPLDLVRRCHELWRDGDWEAALALMHDDVEWGWDDPLTGRSRHRGRVAVRDLWRKVESVWSDFRMEAESYEEFGDGVVISTVVHGRGTASGIPVQMRFTEVVTVRDGLVAARDAFSDRASALASLGVDEEESLLAEWLPAFGIWNAREWNRWVDLWTEDCQWESAVQGAVEGPGVYEGHDGMRRFIREFEEVWKDLRVNAEHARRHGRVVFVTGWIDGIGHSGVETSAPTSWAFDLAPDGRIRRGRADFDLERGERVAQEWAAE